MTADLFALAADDQLAETIGDTALAALLRAKPVEEEIPAAVWWLLAETLRTSATIRHTLDCLDHATETDRHRQPVQTDLRVLTAEATLLTEAALAELAEATDARPVPVPLPGVVAAGPASPTTRSATALQLSIRFLARLLISHRMTSPQQLADALATHLRDLALIDPERAASR
jgi:hypothetical protein